MSDAQSSSMINVSPKPDLAGAQHGLACWARAYTQAARGFMSASLASMDVVRSIYAPVPGELAHAGKAETWPDALQRLIGSSKTRFETALQAQLRVNDQLTEALFAAASSLAEAVASDQPHGSAEPARPAMPTAVAEPSAHPIVPKAA